MQLCMNFLDLEENNVEMKTLMVAVSFFDDYMNPIFPPSVRENTVLSSLISSDFKEINSSLANELIAFIKSIRKGDFSFALQPIVELIGSPPVGKRVLYYEALLRRGTSRADQRIEQILGDVASCGLMHWLDQSVISAVLDLLDKNLEVILSCNISAQSAVLDAWWECTLLRLREAPELAQRLIIEITEQQPILDIAAAQNFCATLKELGVRISLDDFGAGCSSLGFAMCHPVDIIKIDRSILQRARAGYSGTERFEHLMRLAKVLSPVVVVEGVETLEDQAVAHVWTNVLQGYLYGRP